ncbi:MJ0042-type zinc finger domain-containing protein [Thermogemmata fonticola]|uniref:DUF3566 domain-containing protein n=1 Tax=Thermogemmata fonticola TaxID=2755323 RepID=A0A7V9AC85_9BACT|nr:MJ0042-type zinc finger domain-containing protein [Thermogemmata fonticola]MBA2227016.1 hypothetical protein [Thermogemmata fonticola]
MSILVACPSCGARLKVPDNAAGKTVQCPKCGTNMLVPSSSPSSSSGGYPGGYEAVDRPPEESSPFDEDFRPSPRVRKRRDAQRIVTKIGVLSAGKVMGLLNALIGLIFGVLMTFLSLLGMAVGGNQQGGGGVFAIIFGFGAIICAPILYGLVGFVGGIVGALLYNLVAALVGGIELEVG